MRAARYFFSTIYLILLLLPYNSYCTNYYISSSGNDANSGLSPAQAWQTIQKLNSSFSTILPGDSIFFKRGESFHGTIRVIKSGMQNNPIVFAAYGSGNNPVITGFITITGWQQKSANIFEAPAPAVKPNLNMVILDGIPQRIGRYPNASAADGGYLRYEEAETKNSITDAELGETNNWTGAEIVIRKNHWTAERCRVTAQQGKTIHFTYANRGINPLNEPILYKGTRGNGYFFQNDIRTLDENGEWFFDSTNNKLIMVLNDANHLIKASIVDTLVNTDSMYFISFQQLAFEGANRSAIFNKGGGNISITDCSFINIGAKAIHFWNTGDVIIDKVTTNYVLSNAIQLRTTKKDNAIVKNCVIKHTGPFVGMGSFFDDRDYKAVFVAMHKNVTIENNTVDSSGLSGIQFQGSNALIQKNVISNYCRVLDDGAGIYTYVEVAKEAAGENYTNRIIRNNIILNGAGAPQGSIKVYKAEGIYLDGRTMNVDILDNTIANTGNKAIAMNNPVNITIRNNNCFNNGGGWGANRGINWVSIKNLVINNNTFFPLSEEKPLVNFSHSGLDLPVPVTLWQAIKNAGDIDSNYYNIINPVAFVYSFAPIAGKPMQYPSPLTFEHWQEYTGQDLHSATPAKHLPRFLLRSKKGNNLVANGTFDSDIKGIYIYGSGVKMQWDGSGKLTGSGALKVECSEPQPNRFSLIHGEAGNLQAGKKYLLRFKTTGNSDCGIVKVYLRKTERPYTSVTSTQVQPFSSEVRQHEFILSPEVSGKASFVVELEKNSCVAYFDDIELHEADATVINIKDHVRFEYNASGNPINIQLDKNYVGVDGTPYSNTLTLEPFTSKILIEDADW